MIVEEGYVYHVKEEYFKLVKDDKLMKNHEGNSTRPNYFCVKLEESDILWFIPMKLEESDILWFIPMSSKVDKYRKIIDLKIKKYKKCDTIVIGNYRGKNHAFLIQNMFPIIAKYIDHIDTVNGKALQVPSETRRIILEKVNKVFKLKKNGVNLIFPDVDNIKGIY